MIELNNTKITLSIAHLASFSTILKNAASENNRSGKASVKIGQSNESATIVAVNDIIEVSDRAGLGLSNSANRVLSQMKKVRGDNSSLSIEDAMHLAELCQHLVYAFHDKLDERRLFSIETRHAIYISPNYTFGEGVDSIFPEIIPEISEAAKCRALARWTACVMHLMRILEIGLERLAEHCGINDSLNWNDTLNRIESSLRKVRRTTDGVEEEQWAAEAGTHLRFLKNAYRNHAMHPRERYDEERAVEIFDNTRSFMRHLSKKLAE